MKKEDCGMAAGEPERSSDLVQKQFPQLLPAESDVTVARDDRKVASEIQTLETCGYNLSGPFEFVGTLEINPEVKNSSTTFAPSPAPGARVLP